MIRQLHFANIWFKRACSIFLKLLQLQRNISGSLPWRILISLLMVQLLKVNKTLDKWITADLARFIQQTLILSCFNHDRCLIPFEKHRLTIVPTILLTLELWFIANTVKAVALNEFSGSVFPPEPLNLFSTGLNPDIFDILVVQVLPPFTRYWLILPDLFYIQKFQFRWTTEKFRNWLL